MKSLEFGTPDHREFDLDLRIAVVEPPAGAGLTDDPSCVEAVHADGAAWSCGVTCGDECQRTHGDTCNSCGGTCDRTCLGETCDNCV